VEHGRGERSVLVQRVLQRDFLMETVLEDRAAIPQHKRGEGIE
jgi:hypothetical protein